MGSTNKVLLSHPEIISSKIDSFDSQKEELLSQQSMENNMDVPDTAHYVDNKYVPIHDLNFNTGLAGDVITSILRKAQRDEQILKNISKSNKQGFKFISSMETAKKFSADVIFKHGECYLDEDILLMAINAKQKKRETFQRKDM